MELSIKVERKDNEYLASCPELDIFCYGPTPEKARLRLQKVMVFYAETASQLGYNIDAEELLTSLKDAVPNVTSFFQ
ncbi:MAG: hypothetical protein D6767_08090 [Candidatus Hydrogenedentota bacterium]|nr:MAG: hypothetical protein D6767_08090 [Candidatus Hydrogenedentota bacterium]